jgi:hypothetical protein
MNYNDMGKEIIQAVKEKKIQSKMLTVLLLLDYR